MNSKEEYLAKWTEFIDIHLQNLVIHFEVFSDILNNLVKSLTETELTDYEVKYLFTIIFQIKILNVLCIISIS